MKKWLIVALVCLVGCIGYFALSVFSKRWPIDLRVNIETPGGPLPFRLVLLPDGRNDWIVRISQNGIQPFFDQLNPNELDAIKVEHIAGRFIVQFPYYDSFILLNRDINGSRTGAWHKFRGDSGPVQIPLTAVQRGQYFDPIEDAGEPAVFSGRWSVDFDSSDDLAIGTFTVDENQIASGTFMTTTGDYRYLAGRVDGNLMRLSTFDGAHAFLFHARMQDDGSIEGDFWSGNWWHETWTAVRDDEAKLPDAFEQTVIADEEALAQAVFKDLEGEPTRVLDVLDQSNAKARIIEIFGTWCPNCSDAGRELVSLKEHYGDDLAIVGLAFEITEDFERSVEQVKRHHEHIGTSWPILIAGLSDKDKATAALGFLDQVRSYPTLVFLNEANEVQAVYSGFSGPATGDAYTEQRERFEALIDGMIEE